ncbi:hypothetical protein HYH02_008215 [Chlamydomonas schloesseri]|uniref:Uncharacterized protein n=1 Tax=Chlamydomonas schloesseri TaxID=2026947 RepID=A0A835WG07_9CHLO|nr:hypothetical protein HYH02_008215 [Chlamydomonas schloesseri]|eukprot:KAG2446643.1 hypothetical protein HYH02_008215 [Chlamydomonas schloesseri]
MLADLNLPMDEVEPALHRERVAALLAAGYDAVAVVHTAAGRLSEADRCKFQPLGSSELAAARPEARSALDLRAGASAPATATLPSATAANSSNSSNSNSTSSSCHLQQLTRLHFVAADVVQAAQLSASGANADLLRGYHLVSITPKNERVLHMACTSLDVDVVCLELSSRMNLKLRPPAVKAALRRGIHFEICYAPGLREVTARRNLFCNAQSLVRATRGRNILLGSSARTGWEVRSPVELVHMAALFGLTRQQAQDAVRLAPRAVLAHAAARLAGRGAAAVGTAAPAAEGDVEVGDAEAAADEMAEGGRQQGQTQAGRARGVSVAAGAGAAAAAAARKRAAIGS